MTQNSGPAGSSSRLAIHRLRCSQPQSSIPTSRPAAALATTDKQRPAAGIEVALVQIECFLDPQPTAPQNDDQPAGPTSIEDNTGTGTSLVEQPQERDSSTAGQPPPPAAKGATRPDYALRTATGPWPTEPGCGSRARNRLVAEAITSDLAAAG